MSSPQPHLGTENPWHRPDDLYADRPAWDTGRPQPAFLALADAGAVRGRVLDVGCGTGEHVLMCAARGMDATGLDLAAKALDIARRKADDRGLAARFVHHDARKLTGLGETFDTVLDCGLFHVIGDDDRAAFVAGLRAVLRPGGRYLMLCFSEHQPGDRGPRRVTRGEIEASFADGWRVDSIEAATIDITTDPAGIPARLAALTRI
ncbi:class I SAM-dependent methyltransferase [Streptomyces sp. NPDC003393]